jgi:hypothetical protein
MGLLQQRIEVISRLSVKWKIQPVLEGSIGSYVSPILEPRIEGTSRGKINATIPPVLAGGKDADI